MKKRIIALLLAICSFLSLSAFTFFSKSKSTFSIEFIDVGQGDSALIECDGQYMLIDAGDKNHGDIVRSVLVEKGIQHLNILAISHFHSDHAGGLIKVLGYTSTIDITIANSNRDPKEQDEGETAETRLYNEVSHQLAIIGSSITIPRVGDKFMLGSASVEVVYVGDTETNDSLVLLITYGKNRFLFTGDIEGKAQKDLTDYLRKDSRVKKDVLKVDLIKMPHHGAFNDGYGSTANNLNSLFWLTSPDYAVISVGKNNRNNHPDKRTLDLLESAKKVGALIEIYRTDLDGNIIVRSNGKKLYPIETTK